MHIQMHKYKQKLELAVVWAKWRRRLIHLRLDWSERPHQQVAQSVVDRRICCWLKDELTGWSPFDTYVNDILCHLVGYGSRQTVRIKKCQGSHGSWSYPQSDWWKIWESPKQFFDIIEEGLKMPFLGTFTKYFLYFEFIFQSVKSLLA